jgi:hypothetical protein
MPKWSRLYCAVAGSCDTITGGLLVASPLLVLRLMGVPPGSSDLVHLRLVGALVAGVGLSYFLPLGRRDRGERRLLAVLEATAVVRLSVATFVAASVIQGALAWQWSSVWITDFALAAVQIAIVARRERSPGAIA